ncbi:MAG: hypothetical protein RBT32_08010 [Methanothermobacter sp.]|jgi:predicted DNA-binding protein|nr:hypothetical protein [Methanothermobacter sp.]
MDEKRHRTVGARVEPAIALAISILSHVKGKTKAQILQEAIDMYIEKHKHLLNEKIYRDSKNALNKRLNPEG